MINFFGRKSGEAMRNGETNVSSAPDKLNQTMSEIAEELIRGDCNDIYRKEMVELFLASPGFIDDVSPSHRKALKKLLQREKEMRKKG